MSKNNNKSKQVKIGIVFLIALFVLYFGINFLKGVNIFTPSNYFTVTFNNVEGMIIADPVVVNGLKIGQVNDMNFDPLYPNLVFVGIQIKKGLKIPLCSTIAMEEGIIGSSTIQLNLPNEVKGYYSPGDTISGTRKTNIMDAVDNVIPKVQSIIPKIDSILTHIDDLLTNPALITTIENAEKLTSQLNNTTSATNDILKKLNNELPLITNNLNSSLSNISLLTEKLSKVDIESTFAKIDNTLKNVELITTKLTQKDNSIGLLLNDRQLYDNINNMLISTDKIIYDLKKDPSKYVNIKVF